MRDARGTLKEVEDQHSDAKESKHQHGKLTQIHVNILRGNNNGNQRTDTENKQRYLDATFNAYLSHQLGNVGIDSIVSTNAQQGKQDNE